MIMEAEYDPESGLLRVAVRDNGRGLSEEGMERLFKPFSQAEGDGTAGSRARTRRIASSRPVVHISNWVSYGHSSACAQPHAWRFSLGPRVFRVRSLLQIPRASMGAQGSAWCVPAGHLAGMQRLPLGTEAALEHA